MTTHTTPPLLTTAQVAERLAVSVDTVLDLIAAGQLRAHRLGHRTIRVDPADVAQLLALSATG
jgi:excisionase family DNA binding protein